VETNPSNIRIFPTDICFIADGTMQMAFMDVNMDVNTDIAEVR
jgi:hypothetical protein